MLQLTGYLNMRVQMDQRIYYTFFRDTGLCTKVVIMDYPQKYRINT